MIDPRQVEREPIKDAAILSLRRQIAEANAEIERLRDELTASRSERNIASANLQQTYSTIADQEREIGALEAEIKQVQAELKQAVEIARLQKQLLGHIVEIERLKEIEVKYDQLVSGAFI